MSDALETTLAATLLEEGLDPQAHLLRWMVMTWDLAKIDDAVDDYYRAFVTVDGSLTCYGSRTKAAFARAAPMMGTVETVAGPDDGPYGWALEATTSQLLTGGYQMVCRPLAVDCSRFASGVARGYDFADEPRELLYAMGRGTALGAEVLSVINRARYEALTTHLDPDWQRNFPVEMGQLWSGLPAYPSW